MRTILYIIVLSFLVIKLCSCVTIKETSDNNPPVKFYLFDGETGEVRQVGSTKFFKSKGIILGSTNIKLYVQDSLFNYQILDNPEIQKTLLKYANERLK